MTTATEMLEARRKIDERYYQRSKQFLAELEDYTHQACAVRDMLKKIERTFLDETTAMARELVELGGMAPANVDAHLEYVLERAMRVRLTDMNAEKAAQ